VGKEEIAARPHLPSLSLPSGLEGPQDKPFKKLGLAGLRPASPGAIITVHKGCCARLECMVSVGRHPSISQDKPAETSFVPFSCRQ
jgi:hypothetical protein